MASLASLKTVAALFFVILFALFARTGDKRQPANIEGYVYETCSDHKLAGPVSGAIVSTSVDAATATTDTRGHFHLVTKSPVFSDEFYNVTVRSGEVVVDDNLLLNNGVSNQAFPRQIGFVFSPPQRVVVRDKSGQGLFCDAFSPRPRTKRQR